MVSGVSLMSLVIANGWAAAQTDAVAAKNNEIEEIVVHTDKVTRDLQKTPAAVTAVDGESLEKMNVVEAADLTGLVPGVTIAKNEGYNRVVSIRGIGFETPQNDSAQPSVAYHLDDVYIVSPIALNADFLDVKQIEVARGPQGTVFGQNATGGNINVVTNQPILGDSSGSASFSYGTYNLDRAEGEANVPIGDTLALRLAVLQNRHDGFAKATEVPGYPNGYDEDNANDVTARLTALWRPVDNLAVTFETNFFNTDQNERAEKSILDPNPDPRELTQDFPGKFRMQSQQYALKADYDLGFADLKSITSLQYLREFQSISNARLSFSAEQALLGPNAADGYGADIIPDTDRRIHSETQEINLASKPGSDLEWLLGAFYLHTKTSVYFVEYVYDGTNSCVQALNCPANPNPADYNSTYNSNPAVDNGGNGFESLAHPEHTSYSFYNQETYHVTNALSLTAGVRFTHDRLESDPANYFAAPTYLYGESSAITERGTVSYDLTPVNNVYLTYSTGYKPGASNLESESDPPLLVPFVAKPETLTSYEFGSKNDLFDKRARFNLSSFFYQYKDFQFAAEDPNPYTGGVANIPHSEVYGLEGEWSVLLPYGLRVDANGSLERSRITSHYLALDPVVGNSINIADANNGIGLFDPQNIQNRVDAERDVYGHSLPKLPKVSANLSLFDVQDLGNLGTLSSRVQMDYHSQFDYRVFANSSTDVVKMAFLVDLNLDYQPSSSPWDFQLTVTNLFDRTFVDSKYTDSFGVGSTSYEYDPPRQIIFKAGYKF